MMTDSSPVSPRKRKRDREAATRKRAKQAPSSFKSEFIDSDFAFPDEGHILDESIVALLEKIDWSIPISRCHSPFMDSAASVSSHMNHLSPLDIIPFDFVMNTDDFKLPTMSKNISPPAAPPCTPNGLNFHNYSLLSVPHVPYTSAPVPTSTMNPTPTMTNNNERQAYTNVMNEFKKVFKGVTIGAYDKLPPIKQLISMSSADISVSYSGSLTSCNSTFCRYPLIDSPLHFDHDSDQNQGMIIDYQSLVQDEKDPAFLPPVNSMNSNNNNVNMNNNNQPQFQYADNFGAHAMKSSLSSPLYSAPQMYGTDQPTPRRRGRPRKILNQYQPQQHNINVLPLPTDSMMMMMIPSSSTTTPLNLLETL
jgi:hypothetical protein